MLTLDRSLPYERILDGLRSARVIGNRVLNTGSKNVLCVVVTAVYAPAKSMWTGRVRNAPITFWIDTTTNIVVQQSFQTTVASPMGHQPRIETWTMTIMRYSINPELPDSRFTFRPTAGILERPCTAFLGGF